MLTEPRCAASACIAPRFSPLPTTVLALESSQVELEGLFGTGDLFKATQVLIFSSCPLLHALFPPR